MTNMHKLKEGIISATLGLQDMLEAEGGEVVHFLSKTEYKKVQEMQKFLTDLYLRTPRT